MGTVQLAGIALLSYLTLHPLSLNAQGNLTPPGPPGPTMLTLSQLQSRIPVDSTHTPGDSTNEFIIGSPGSYYLAANTVGTTNKNGIEIATNNVTLDLNGYSLLGVTNSLNGIVISAGTTNTIVRNGFISGWGMLLDGVLSFGNNIDLEDLIISGGGLGIEGDGKGGIIKNCSMSRASGYGVFLTDSNYLVSCNYIQEINTGNFGNGAAIYIDSANNRIDGNVVVGSSPSGFGIWIINSLTVTGNIVTRNSVSGALTKNYSINGSLNDVGLIGDVSTNTSTWGNISN